MIGFEEGAVLESTDGLHVAEIPIEKSTISKSSSKSGQRERQQYEWKSLRDQLAENKTKEEAENADRYNPFKPPPGMNEDEYQFMLENEELKWKEKASKLQQTELDKKMFEEAKQRKLVMKGSPDLPASSSSNKSSPYIPTSTKPNAIQFRSLTSMTSKSSVTETVKPEKPSFVVRPKRKASTIASSSSPSSPTQHATSTSTSTTGDNSKRIKEG